MLKVKIKSFEDAVQAAIEGGKESVVGDECLALYGIHRDWNGWGSVIDVQIKEIEMMHGVKYVYYSDGVYYIPIDCVEYVTEN